MPLKRSQRLRSDAKRNTAHSNLVLEWMEWCGLFAGGPILDSLVVDILTGSSDEGPSVSGLHCMTGCREAIADLCPRRESYVDTCYNRRQVAFREKTTNSKGE